MFKDKSDANLLVVKLCLGEGRFNDKMYSIGASRLYYSLYLLIQFLFKNNKYYPNSDNSKIKHGELPLVLTDYLSLRGEEKNTCNNIIAWIYAIYRSRQKADYTEDIETRQDLERHIRNAEKIIKIINNNTVKYDKQERMP